MNPSDVRLDAHGFPIPPNFVERPVEEASPKAPRNSSATLAIRAMLIALAIGTAIMAFERAGLGEPLGGAVAQWLARHAYQKLSADDLAGALRDLDRALGWSDNSAEIYALRGQVRLEMNDLEGGLADFNKVVSMEPMSSGAYELRSMSLQRLERHEEAIHDISQAVQMRRSDPNLLNARAYTRAIAGLELNQALEDIQLAMRLEGENSHFLDTRGYIYFLLGEYEKALVDIDRAVEMARRNAPAAFSLESHPRGDKVLARAKRRYENVLAVMYHHRGQVHEKLGNSKQAEADLRQGDVFGYNLAAGVY